MQVQYQCSRLSINQKLILVMHPKAITLFSAKTAREEQISGRLPYQPTAKRYARQQGAPKQPHQDIGAEALYLHKLLRALGTIRKFHGSRIWPQPCTWFFQSNVNHGMIVFAHF
jgi:hypothetical protein